MDNVNVLQKADNLNISTAQSGYSSVRIYTGTDDDGNPVVIEAGTETGQVLEIKNPFGTAEMANNILAAIKGFQYQPYSSENVQLDPSAELGDGITINSVYSGLYVRATQFGRRMTSDVSAPSDNEIEHEFAVDSPSDRQYTRFVAQTKSMLKVTNLAIEAEVEARQSADEAISATLAIHASDIQARVTKDSPAGQTSFGWHLDDTSWTVFSGNESNTILKATANGLEVKGVIRATSGEIGGFKITSNSLTYNNQTWGGTNSTGIYIGPSGIQLGKNFKVDSAGNLSAASGTFSGNVYAGNIQYGGSAGYMSGGGISSGSISGNRLVANTISTAYTSSGINASLANADYAFGCVKGWNTIPALHAGSLDTNDLTIGGRQIDRATIRYQNSSGGISTAYVLVWA